MGGMENSRETQMVWESGDKGRETSYLNATSAKVTTGRSDISILGDL